MLHSEHNSRNQPTIPTISPLVTLFKPRQLLLSNPTMKKSQQNHSIKTPVSLNSEQRVLLYHSISQFLELNGFLKTLKKFQRETDIEKNSWKNCSLNLEEMCQEYLQLHKVTDAKVLDTKQNDEADNHVPSVKTVKKTKKNEVDDEKEREAIIENNSINGDAVKSKKKKKNAGNDNSNHLDGDSVKKDTEHEVDDTLSVPSEKKKKSKDKKKKRKHEVEDSERDLPEKNAEVAGEKPVMVDAPVPRDKVEEGKKTSKKRKKSCIDDSKTDNAEERPANGSKRRKGNDLNHSNSNEDASKTPNGIENGVSGKDGEKSEKQNKTKECNDSAEPRSANAFRRVKADEVEFADERLQNNSYWAKDGADSGYGAKAEEVLGQVRGRDFRHEKTKKKRGSYRGGKIDLQSHSVKYFYNEDDE